MRTKVGITPGFRRLPSTAWKPKKIKLPPIIARTPVTQSVSKVECAGPVGLGFNPGAEHGQSSAATQAQKALAVESIDSRATSPRASPSGILWRANPSGAAKPAKPLLASI